MDIVGIKRFLNKNKDKTLDEIISESVVNGIGNVIGNSSSPIGEDTIFGLLKGGMVKSVQRGTVTFSDSRDRTINISAVNPSKTIVLIRSENDAGSVGGYGGEVWSYPNYSSVLKSLSSNSFTISFSVSYTTVKYVSSAIANYGVVSWQVIEFK